MIILLAIMAGIYSVPFVVSAAMRAISPEKILGGSRSDRDFTTRESVVATFLNGLAGGILGYNPSRRSDYLSLNTFHRPFYVEGAYAGLQLAQYLAPWRAIRNRRIFKERHERFVFLLTIGSGFSYGMRTLPTSFAIEPGLVKDIDPRLRLLFFDGCAFEKFVFGGTRNTRLLERGLFLGQTPRIGFYEGAGRALWFLQPKFSDFCAYVSPLPTDCKANCYVGYGIACGFAGCERVADGALRDYPREILNSVDFQTGLIIGLFARYYSDPIYIETLLAKNSGLLQQVKHASVLFNDFWAQGVSYEQWRSTLKERFIADSAALPYSQPEVAPPVGAQV